MTTFLIKIKDAQLDFGTPFNTDRFKAFLKDHEGAWLRIEHEEPVRSLSQNNLYWLYLEVIARETGHSAQELHEWAKRMFLPPRFVTVMGQEMKLPATTTALGKAEFGDYLDKIAAETGVPIPDPQAAGYLPH